MKNATVIGAGPSGCVAAVLLARAGWQITLVEQHRFPRDKVCGECLSALGIDVLCRLGLDRRAIALSPVELKRSAVFPTAGSPTTLKLPRVMWGLSRAKLDAFLLDAARESAVLVMQPARCEKTGDAFLVRDLITNTVRPLDSSLILLADGKGSLLDHRPAGTGDLGIKSHWQNVDCPRDAISMFGVEGHYGGIAPIEDDRWNIAFSVPAGRLAANRGDLDRLFASIIAENRHLSQALSAADRCSDWLSCALPRFAVHSDWPAGVIPLGNAAAALEPIGGEGMGLAMRSAEIVAEELIAADLANRKVDLTAIRARFDKLWRVRRAACRAGAMLVSRPRIANLAVQIVDDSPYLKTMALSLMGKS